MPDRLGDGVLALLRERLGDAGAPFAEAVTLQLTRAGAAAAAEDGTARRVSEIVASPGGEQWPGRLAADPELLSSFFQNVDLLYRHGFAEADAVGLLIMRALEMAGSSQP